MNTPPINGREYPPIQVECIIGRDGIYHICYSMDIAFCVKPMRKQRKKPFKYVSAKNTDPLQKKKAKPTRDKAKKQRPKTK